MPMHYYCFSFFDVRNGQATYASSYYGLEAQRVTASDFLSAKQHAKVSSTATLLACTNHGHMTQQQFNA